MQAFHCRQLRTSEPHLAFIAACSSVYEHDHFRSFRGSAAGAQRQLRQARVALQRCSWCARGADACVNQYRGSCPRLTVSLCSRSSLILRVSSSCQSCTSWRVTAGLAGRQQSPAEASITMALAAGPLACRQARSQDEAPAASAWHERARCDVQGRLTRSLPRLCAPACRREPCRT